MSDTIPVRCFSCNKVVGNKWDSFLAKLLTGQQAGPALTELGLSRVCCRSMLLNHVPVTPPITSPR
jgi:DNA-directed RNA polymerase subunit N (RpoN/RPB10)